jgi:hypothetical protein
MRSGAFGRSAVEVSHILVDGDSWEAKGEDFLTVFFEVAESDKLEAADSEGSLGKSQPIS